MGTFNMQSKIDAMAAPAAVAFGSGFFSLNFMMDEGLPFLALLFNVLLALAGLLLMFSKWRISRLEYRRALIDLKEAEDDAPK